MPDLQKNADRFTGFAKIYDDVRPKSPVFIRELLTEYLDRTPSCVVDLGCGTGRSSLLWAGHCGQVIGIEPSDDMRKQAQENVCGQKNIRFIKAFGHETGLKAASADIVTSSQSFHWMDPLPTLAEVGRILTPGGVFAAYDYDWPPVIGWKIELCFRRFSDLVTQLEFSDERYKDQYTRQEKSNHLENIRASGQFRYVRELFFYNREECDAERFIGFAVSRGSLQMLLKAGDPRIAAPFEAFQEEIRTLFAGEIKKAGFCYRVRIGVK